MWSRLAVFACVLAGSSWAMWYIVKLSIVAKYVLQPSEMVQVRLALAKWDKIATMHC
jgi:hypothetical protein